MEVNITSHSHSTVVTAVASATRWLFVVDCDRPVRRLRVLDGRSDAGAVAVVSLYRHR